MEIWRCKQSKTQFNSEKFFILIDNKAKVLRKFYREKKTATKENLVKSSLPLKLHGVLFSTLAEQQQRREVAWSCHTTRGPRALLGRLAQLCLMARGARAKSLVACPGLFRVARSALAVWHHLVRMARPFGLVFFLI